MTISGRCLCGAVSYSCDADPVLTGNCHCSDCKRASGSGYAPTMFFTEESVSITGDVRYFDVTAASGNTNTRGFCPVCGSQLFGKPSAMSGLLAVRAGTLDEPERYVPQIDIFTDDCAAWDVMDESIPKFSGMPTEE